MALEILKTGANVFLTGEPGSGKTYLLNRYIKYLKENHIKVAVTASTGIAATHVNGMTIHSWSGIGIKNFLDQKTLKHIAETRYISERINNTKVLVIDEISMLTSNIVTMVDMVCRAVRTIDAPFGGMQVILVGDFFQLPPVIKKDENEVQIQIDQNQNFFAYESPVWDALKLSVCYLTEQHRQEDADFLSLLSAIRSDTIEIRHREHLDNRTMLTDGIPDNIPKLFSHNINVDNYNNKILNTLPGEARSYEMQSKGNRNLVGALQRGCLSPETLVLKPGARVMFTKNNFSEGYVNGSLGTVINFSKTSGTPVVRLDSGKKIETEYMDWKVDDNNKTLAQISQIPLRLAWAITVHKSQGMNLDAAAMDLSSAFEYGQGYVALSRVRKLSGLYLVSWNEMATKVHPEIISRDKVFREISAKTEEDFRTMGHQRVSEMQREFVSANSEPGGGKKKKKSTYKETLELWRAGGNINDIAAERGLGFGTIISHIEKLRAEGEINDDELIRLLTKHQAQVMPYAAKAFQKFSAEKLKPAYEALGGRLSYTELRIARLLIESGWYRD